MLGLLATSIGLFAQEKIDNATIEKIKVEGLKHSQIMDIIFHLTDESGNRLTNSPGYFRAANYAKDKLNSWGITNATIDPWGEFGKGWELQKSYIEDNVLHLLFTNGGQLKNINSSGKTIWNKLIPVREFSNISTTKIGNDILITIFDGVENKVLFYNSKGEKLNSNIKHASTEVQVTPFGASGTSTTTLLGNLLIQYNSY